MAELARPPDKQSLQIAGLIAGMAIALNVVFWVMSSMYFANKPAQVAADLGGVRIAFVLMSSVVAVAAVATVFAPRLVGHGLAVLIGVASLVGGIIGLASNLPPVMGMTLLVSGALLPALAVFSLKGSRPAWSFLLAILCVLATVTFFGAPKIRHLLDISLWHALVMPGLQIVAVVALSMLRGDYKARA